MQHIRRIGKRHWVKEISVTNREFFYPKEIKFEDFETKKLPQGIAAEEVVMLEDGRFMRQRKMSEHRKHLLSPF